MVLQAFSFIIIKKTTETLSSKQTTAVILLLGAIFLVEASFALEPKGYEQFQGGTPLLWSILIISAILATGLGHLFYNTAIQQIGAGQTAIFNNLFPFFCVNRVLFLFGRTNQHLSGDWVYLYCCRYTARNGLR